MIGFNTKIYFSQVFEEVGIAPNIKRICGASVGSIAGALLAVDYDSKKLYELLSLDMQKILIGKFLRPEFLLQENQNSVKKSSWKVERLQICTNVWKSQNNSVFPKIKVQKIPENCVFSVYNLKNSDNILIWNGIQAVAWPNTSPMDTSPRANPRKTVVW